MEIQEAIKLLEEMKENCKTMPFEYRDEKATLKAEAIDTVLAELKESKKEGKWKPNYGDTYWFRDTLGNFGCSEYCAGDCIEWRLNNMPLFPTRKECERYWHFMDTLKEKSYEFSKEDFSDNNIPKFYIESSYGDKEIYVTNTWHYKKLGMIYFKDKESAQYIIDNFKDELMEYWI